MKGIGPAIYCADIGPVRQGNFGWAVVDGDEQRGGKAVGRLGDDVVCRLAAETKIALGFECPLWVPVPDDPSRLTERRAADGGKTWSAAGGTSAPATGLTETAWILREIRRRLKARGALAAVHASQLAGFQPGSTRASCSGKRS